MDGLEREIRDEIIRGLILSVLVKHRLDWVTFGSLRVQIQRGQGFALEEDELRFHLAYLGDSARGYIENKSLRAGRAATGFSLVRATAKAVDLLDGRINPGCVFDFETDLDGIAEAYAAMDERRAIKSLVRVGSV